jgi:hypothetical protein
MHGKIKIKFKFHRALLGDQQVTLFYHGDLNQSLEKKFTGRAGCLTGKVF